MTPEEIAQTFYDGLVEQHGGKFILLAAVLPALAALIRAEQTIAARDEREACAQLAESFIAVARDDRARTIAHAIRQRTDT